MPSRRSASPASRSAATSTARRSATARFDPFFEACEALGAAVFVHALKPAGMDRLIGPPPLQQVLAYPDRRRAGRGVVHHRQPGRALPAAAHRLQPWRRHPGDAAAAAAGGLEGVPGAARLGGASPVEQARRLYYDTLVYDQPTLQHLVATFGATQLMIGTDYPFNFHERTPVARIEACGFEAETAARLVHRNAESFLGLRVTP